MVSDKVSLLNNIREGFRLKRVQTVFPSGKMFTVQPCELSLHIKNTQILAAYFHEIFPYSDLGVSFKSELFRILPPPHCINKCNATNEQRGVLWRMACCVFSERKNREDWNVLVAWCGLLPMQIGDWIIQEQGRRHVQFEVCPCICMQLNKGWG